MKKLIAFVFLIALIGCGAVIAEDTTTFESVFYIRARHTLPASSSQELKKQFERGKLDSALTSFLKECKPYEENINVEVIGINFTINLKSDGWINDKCAYHLSGKINSISESTRDDFKIYAPNSEIAEIEPKIECNFNQEQLAYLVDSVSENGSPMGSEKTIKNAISRRNSGGEDKLIAMFEKDKVCSITNKEELMEKFSKLDFSSINP